MKLNQQHLTAEDAAAYLTERFAKTGVSRTFSLRLLENWRHQGKGPAHTKIAGRVYYALHELDTFVADLLNARTPTGRPAKCIFALPGPALAQQATLAEAARTWWLVESRTLLAEHPHHAGRVDAAAARAAQSLIALATKAARDAVITMALHRTEIVREGMENVQPGDLVAGLRELTSEFEEQLAQLDDDVLNASIVRDQLAGLRAPLRNAVSRRLDQLVAEQQALVSKRNALGHGKRTALDSELLSAGIPADRLAAVREAVGEPHDVPAAVEELSGQINGLMSRIEALKAFSAHQCAPGDYRLLDGEGLDLLIAAERAALGLAD